MEFTKRSIKDHYKIQQFLGRGAFAHVRKANFNEIKIDKLIKLIKNRETGKEVAIKVYQKC
jgi:hypothetical protein